MRDMRRICKSDVTPRTIGICARQTLFRLYESKRDKVPTAPERILKPSVKSRPLAVKKICLALSPDTTITVFWGEIYVNKYSQV